MKTYADTSVFGGVFDPEFSGPSRQFFDEVDAGRFVLVTSAVVEAEIEPAPENVRTFFAKRVESASIADVTEEALGLRSNYIQLGVVTETSLNDALHVAIATVSGCDLIIRTLTQINLLSSVAGGDNPPCPPCQGGGS